MKLHLLARTTQNNQSFNVSHNSYPHFLKVWHYHPELELVVIQKSTGTHFIGDHIGRFEPGDVVLIGKNLPHMWLNDEIFFKEKQDHNAQAVAVHFRKDFMGEAFICAPENSKMTKLLDLAVNGLKFTQIHNQIREDIHALLDREPFDRLILFLQILHKLALEKGVVQLSSPSFMDNYHSGASNRLDKVYGFVYKNFKDNINSGDVAYFIGMNASAFSRYFKRIHGKTFTAYLNEIRIGYACKLLLENEVKITQIGFACGFNNLSNFNRQFKTLTKVSPSKYRQIHACTLQ